MTTIVDPLFSTFKLKTLHLKNRIVMAPMTRARAWGGIPNQDTASYYRRRAEAGVGLVLSEGTVVDRPSARNEPNVPSFYGDAALAGWKTVVDEVHAVGGRIGPQLWHVGGVRHANPAEPEAEPLAVDGTIDSPSGLDGNDRLVGEPMTEEAISDTIAAFARAAGTAQRLGFDVIEIHAAHGYLIDQFFWSRTNLRNDRFGGESLSQRSSFAVELVKAVRADVGPDLPVIVRVSQWKQQDYSARLVHSPTEVERWLGPIVDAGADAIHCSQRRFWEPEFPEVDGPDGLNLAGWAKKLLGCTTITVGSVGLSSDLFSMIQTGESSKASGLDHLVRRLERGEFDLVAVGRALIADAHWASKVRIEDLSRLKGFSLESLNEYP